MVLISTPRNSPQNKGNIAEIEYHGKSMKKTGFNVWKIGALLSFSLLLVNTLFLRSSPFEQVDASSRSLRTDTYASRRTLVDPDATNKSRICLCHGGGLGHRVMQIRSAITFCSVYDCIVEISRNFLDDKEHDAFNPFSLYTHANVHIVDSCDFDSVAPDENGHYSQEYRDLNQRKLLDAATSHQPFRFNFDHATVFEGIFCNSQPDDTAILTFHKVIRFKANANDYCLDGPNVSAERKKACSLPESGLTTLYIRCGDVYRPYEWPKGIMKVDAILADINKCPKEVVSQIKDYAKMHDADIYHEMEDLFVVFSKSKRVFGSFSQLTYGYHFFMNYRVISDDKICPHDTDGMYNSRMNSYQAAFLQANSTVLTEW